MQHAKIIKEKKQIEGFFSSLHIGNIIYRAEEMVSVSTQNEICQIGNKKIPHFEKLIVLTHISLASHFWDTGKQCRPRSDAAERGVWSGPSLFAYRNFYQN